MNGDDVDGVGSEVVLGSISVDGRLNEGSGSISIESFSKVILKMNLLTGGKLGRQ